MIKYKIVTMGLLTILAMNLFCCGIDPNLKAKINADIENGVSPDISSTSDNQIGFSPLDHIVDDANCRWDVLPVKVNLTRDEDLAVLKMWNYEMDYTVFVADEDGINFNDIDLNSKDENGNRYFVNYSWTCDKEAGKSDADIDILSGLNDSDRQIVLAHALGHLLGFDHLDHGIMGEGGIPYNDDLSDDILATRPDFLSLYDL